MNAIAGSAAPLVLCLLAACGGDRQESTAQGRVTAADAVCEPTPPGRRATACYLTLTSQAAETLVAATASVAQRTELQENRLENGMLVQTRLSEGIALAAGRPERLHLQGRHLRLMGVDKPLKIGDRVRLTLNFATAEPVEIEAAVASRTP